MLLLLVVPKLARSDTDQADRKGTVLFELDFGNDTGLPPQLGLEQHGFELHRDAVRENHIQLSHHAGLLHILVKRPSFGLAARRLNAPRARTLRLHWGMSDYPDGASYGHGVDNEATRFYVFFGEERRDSGEVLIPDSPYFVGFYLCPPDRDQVYTHFVGHLYEKIGRYECVDCSIASNIDPPRLTRTLYFQMERALKAGHCSLQLVGQIWMQSKSVSMGSPEWRSRTGRFTRS